MMRRRLARTSLAVLAAAGSLGVSGCFDKHAVVRVAETEGVYVDLGGLDYQVQISRILNPNIVPDDGYLQGIPEYAQDLEDDETWFGVFLRVQNQTDEPHAAVEEIKIVDTTGEEFTPVDVDPDANPFVYEPVVVPPHTTYPNADSAGGDNSTQGQLLLFKLTYESLGNRPIELEFEDEDGTMAKINLDL